MTDDADLTTELGHEDAFEMQMRGYSRRQVDEFVARSRSQTRDLEERLSRALDEMDGLRLELTAARQSRDSKPAHEEISERVGQILKLADDEAKAQRDRAQDEIRRQRDEAKKETERHRGEARDQAERMLKAAQEQAENAIVAARSEADKLRQSAQAEAERAVSEATKEADNTLASAKAQAKQMLDEATARASAIHDGAERRLNLLTSRHTETMRRLTEIRDVVTNLVASENTRGSLEDEVAKSVAASFAAAGAGAPAPARPGGADDGRPPGVRPAVREAGRARDRVGADMAAEAGHTGHRPSPADDDLGRHGDPGSDHEAPARAGRPVAGSGGSTAGRVAGRGGGAENMRMPE